MNSKYTNSWKRTIRELFNDDINLKYEIPQECRKLENCAYKGGELFETEDGEFINIDFQVNDFDEKEITKYIEFAEEIYEKHNKPITIYIICPDNVNICVKECKILSEADFTIKIIKINEDPAETMLEYLKNKADNGEIFDYEDLYYLERLPVFCKKEKRNYFREEYFKLINRIL